MLKALRSVIHSFTYSFTHSFIHSFIHSFVRSFVRFFFVSSRSFVSSFIHSFVRLFVCWVIVSSIRSFTCAAVIIYLRFSLRGQEISSIRSKKKCHVGSSLKKNRPLYSNRVYTLPHEINRFCRRQEIKKLTPAEQQIKDVSPQWISAVCMIEIQIQTVH